LFALEADLRKKQQGQYRQKVNAPNSYKVTCEENHPASLKSMPVSICAWHPLHVTSRIEYVYLSYLYIVGFKWMIPKGNSLIILYPVLTGKMTVCEVA